VPFVAIILASWFLAASSLSSGLYLRWIAPSLSAVIATLLVLGSIGSLLALNIEFKRLGLWLAQFYVVPAVALGLFGLVALATVVFSAKRNWRYWGVPPVILTISFFAVIFPITSNSLSERIVAEELVSKVPDGAKILSVGYEFYGTVFYSQRALFRSEVVGCRSGDYVLAFKRDFDLAGKVCQRGFDVLGTTSRSVINKGRTVYLLRAQ
jgi:hypothetical protein